MHILISATVVSFIGIVLLFFYRLWEIKRGKVVVSEHVDSTHDIPEKIFYFCHNHVKKMFLFIKYHLPWYKNKLVVATNTITNGSNAMMFKNLINGKGEIGNEKKSASLYLKDITEHKNNIKQSEE